MSLIAAALILWSGVGDAPWCYQGRVTGYVRGEGNAHTYDGTSVYTEEPIAAAGWDIPMGSMVVVEDAGIYRVADRGRLGPGHIDILVSSRTEAYALTSVRNICVFPPGF
jgi:3D (Asp-Asp-Asp) domain-containing protein